MLFLTKNLAETEIKKSKKCETSARKTFREICHITEFFTKIYGLFLVLSGVFYEIYTDYWDHTSVQNLSY